MITDHEAFFFCLGFLVAAVPLLVLWFIENHEHRQLKDRTFLEYYE